MAQERISRPPARDGAAARFAAAAGPALESKLAAGIAGYDRAAALARFHRLSPATIGAETPEAARAVLREIAGALRAARARRGHWSYDLERHIFLLIAWRAENARLARLEAERRSRLFSRPPPS
jgi:hypothetical protein